MNQQIFVFTDGGARGNPGPAAVGVVVKNQQGKTLTKFGKLIGRATNNVAEYRSVIEAFFWLKKNYSTANDTITFFLDSKLVVNQLNGFFKIKNSNLRNLIIQIRQFEKGINAKIFYRLIPREKNQDADYLVNKTLNTQTYNGKSTDKF